MDINELTIAEIKQIASMAACLGSTDKVEPDLLLTPVVVCTDKRGVVFGYTSEPLADPIQLNNARMCLYWAADVGGVFGLAEKGPTSGCKISATAPSVSLSGITAVFSVSGPATAAWLNAPVKGR